MTISSCTYTMENCSSFLNFFSIDAYRPYFSEWFSNNQESLIISNLRKDINEFENQLKLDKGMEFQKTYTLPLTIQLFGGRDDDEIPDMFLAYCYLQKFHACEFYMNLKRLDKSDILLKKCQIVSLNGYSALGAAMIAKEVSFEKRRTFIQELIDRGFKPTQKDITIAKLYLHDSIPAKDKEIFFHLIHEPAKANWSVLPKEIRSLIVRYMIQILKNKFWLL